MIFPNVIRRIQFKSSIDFKQGIPYRIRPVAKSPLHIPRETHETRTPATKTNGTPSKTHSPDAVKTIPTQPPPRSGDGRMQKGFGYGCSAAPVGDSHLSTNWSIQPQTPWRNEGNTII